jgi:hypothetical protein
MDAFEIVSLAGILVKESFMDSETTGGIVKEVLEHADSAMFVE